MKKTSLLIAGLIVSLAVLTGVALRPPTVTAGIFCDQLVGCAGDAGCAGPGTVSGCYINCENGALVYCGIIIII